MIQDALPVVSSIDAPYLEEREEGSLLGCINQVRAGEREFYVLLTNRKVTKSRKRIANEDYVPHPGLTPDAHKGWLVAAPTNQRKEVYLHVLDDARKSEKNPEGHTRITMQGIRHFEVLRERPGRLADPDPVAPQLQQQQPQQPEFDPSMIQAQAQALALGAQALSLQAQNLAAQVQQIPQPIQSNPL